VEGVIKFSDTTGSGIASRFPRAGSQEPLEQCWRVPHGRLGPIPTLSVGSGGYVAITSEAPDSLLATGRSPALTQLLLKLGAFRGDICGAGVASLSPIDPLRISHRIVWLFRIAEGAQKGTNRMIFLPRIARSLHHPALAVVLGMVLVGIAIFGLVGANISKLWAILILVVGALSMMRAVPHPDGNRLTKPGEDLQTPVATG
jgi:hypothetical protein